MPGYADFAYYYDRLTENVDYRAVSDRVLRLLNKYGVKSGILLDLACGTGSLSMLLAQKGYDVIGVDASEDMLSVAQEKKLKENADVIFLCQKMQELDLFGTIDAAVCTLDSLNHVTDENDVKEIFHRVSLFMNDAGLFIFDVNTPYKHKNVLGNNTFVYDLGDVFCVWQNEFDGESCSTGVFLDIFEENEDGSYERYQEEFSERGYSLKDIEKWVRDCRFEVLCILDGENEKEPTDTSERAVFVCRKHGTQLQ